MVSSIHPDAIGYAIKSMTTLLEQAFTAASALPQIEQDKIAELIFREIERLQKKETPKKHQQR